MAEEEICALCYESLADSEPNLDTITTQCCQEPICHSCASLTNSTETAANFTCVNCSASTSIVTKSFTEVITAVLTNIRDDYDSVLADNQSRLDEITVRRSQVEQLVEQLDLNLTAVTTATNPVGQLDQVVLATAIPQYRQAYTKVIDLARAELKQSYQQTLAALKYLTKLGRTLARLENTSVSQRTCNQADLTSLLRLSYDLMVLTTSKELVAIPMVLSYQPVRLFNHRLVLDDVSEQFSAAVKNKPRHRVVHTRIVEILDQQFGLEGAKVAFLVELPGGSGTHPVTGSIIEPPPYLTCYVSDVVKGFALVDQTGQVVYYRPDTILTINSTWLVSLVLPELDSAGYQPDQEADNYFIDVKNLTQLLQQPQWYRFGRETGLENLSPLISLKINLKEASFGPRQPSADIKDDDLSIFYPLSGYIWRFQQWHLVSLATVTEPMATATEPMATEPMAKPSQQFDLSPGLEVLSVCNNTVVVVNGPLNQGRSRYYCDTLTNLLTSGGNEVSLSNPIRPGADDWSYFQDGSVLIDNQSTQLWRPDGVIKVGRIRGNVRQYNTTPWDGRLFKVTTIDGDIEDEADGPNSVNSDEDGDDDSYDSSLTDGVTIAIEFY